MNRQNLNSQSNPISAKNRINNF